MDALIFATGNSHKVSEIQAALGDQLRILSLRDAGLEQEMEEPFETLEENARAKSSLIYSLSGKSCFAEDSGLEVEALGGAPGVRSARYAGSGANAESNTAKLLDQLKGKENRRAQFRTIISLFWEGKEVQFEGICQGRILAEPRGNRGFGYDPVFQPEGSTRSFAEMDMEEKNRFSHRRKAADQLVRFLMEQAGSPVKQGG